MQIYENRLTRNCVGCVYAMSRDSIVQHVLARVALLATFRRPSLCILLHPTDHTLKLFNKLLKKTHTQKSMYINQESPVITATHCLYKFRTEEMKIRLGCLKCLLFLANLVPRNRNLARVIRRVSLIYKIRQVVN